MSKMFQIYEDDLADLEKLMPEIAERLLPSLDNLLRVKVRRMQTILSNVRWNYGPPSDVEAIDADVD